ncbi:MAG: hypothetical protein OEY56_04415 [Cyclobacteriaceae bacterium]|nr:hypothetical protein [Cyclobacteriaceae bacterium]
MRHDTRHNILKLNEVFARHLIDVQTAKHKPSEDEYSEGDRIILDDSNKAVTLTKEKAEELNAEDRKYFDSKRDLNPFDSDKKFKWIARATLISSKKDSDSYLHDLGESLEKLRLKLNSKDLITLGDWSTPWLSQDNDYKPVKESLDWLSKRIDVEFNGGFLLNETDLVQFIPRLFWLTRCNMSLPEFMMTFEKCKTIFSICKHGVLHLESYDQIELNDFLDFYQSLGFKQTDNCSDPVDFDKFEGREIKLSS